MGSQSSYARFYKCDLHIHSPLDPHWRDDATRLKESDPDDRKTAVAQEYLHACHAAGLEVIALTDHNFAPGPEQSFLRWLRQENESVAQTLGRPSLVIFPGFEIQADVGKGYHVLCLFPPKTPLDVVDSRLTALGLPPDKRFDAKGKPRATKKHLDDVLAAVQNDEQYQGIVIAPHPFEHGILDDDQMEIWLQQVEFCNPNLLAIEIPKPFENLSSGLQKLLRNGPDCLPEWRRARPMAYVMSSDSFRLNEDPAQPGNSIGYRFTWIKMSQPSVESLRQAFLDHNSRIRFGNQSPDDGYRYHQIRSVLVQKASFLRRLEPLVWSPNLNCLIGSRGAGKSTLLDYMRLALDRLRQDDLPASLYEEVKGRVRDTLTPETRIELEVEKAGVVYRLVYTGEGESKSRVFQGETELPDPDLRALFPCRFLSQREIDHSVGRRDRSALRKFLDDFIRPELGELERREQAFKGQIGEIEAALAAKRESQKRRATLETERSDLENQMKNQQRLSELLPRWQGVETERDFFARLFQESQELVDNWRSRLDDLDLRATLLTEDLRTSPHSNLIADVANMADQSVQQLRQAIEKAIADFEVKIQSPASPLQTLYHTAWQPRFEQARGEFEAAQREAQAGGANVQSLTEIPQKLLAIKAGLAALDREQVAINQLEKERANALAFLRQVWRDQTQLRQRKATELMDRLRPEAGKKPYVEIRVEHQADTQEIVKILASRLHDKRRLNDEDLKALIEQLRPAQAGETDLIQQFISATRQGEQSQVLQQALPDRRREAFFSMFTEPVLRQLEMERAPDYVMYYVYRQDGTLAGPIDKVSAGQQGTAILNLLLAAGNEPLIVDTPEEGLDNEGVYAELVPLFRREKEKRQIIIVTHNANLPVNADGEGIFALEAAGFLEEGDFEAILQRTPVPLNPDQRNHLAGLVRWPDWEARVRRYLQDRQKWPEAVVTAILEAMGNDRKAEGRIKVSAEDDQPAIGALDAPAVKRAVQDIMEGSAEAFRLRREKYGF